MPAKEFATMLEAEIVFGTSSSTEEIGVDYLDFYDVFVLVVLPLHCLLELR